MVKFVGLVLLGFAACMVAAVPATEDSNQHHRVRRLSYSSNYKPDETYIPNPSLTEPHGDHYDKVQINNDGSVERTHLLNPHMYNNQQYGRNFGSNPGYISANNPGLYPGHNPTYPSAYNPGYNRNYNTANPRGHGDGAQHDAPVDQIINIGTDEYGHIVANREEVFPDGHKHVSKPTHI